MHITPFLTPVSYTHLDVYKRQIYGSGIIFEYDLDNNKVNKLFDFNNIDTGKSPSGTLFLANNKKFYGTTKTGGKYNYGVLYEFDVINKQFKKLYDFNIQTGGPYLNLIQADNNKLYGIAQYGLSLIHI